MLLPCFVSAPPGSCPHDRITREAARRAGWPRRGEKALLEAVRAPDVAELVLSPRPRRLRRVVAGSAYDPAHHFDRVPPMPDAEAFHHARDHVQAQVALAAALAHDPDAAVRALGRALHAVQDLFSHSNAVDLDGDARRRFTQALRGDGPLPPDVRLVAFLPGVKDPGLPDDPYPHDRYCKDSPRATAEACLPCGDGTKFDAAVEAATQESTRLIRAFLAETGLHDRLERLDRHDGTARTVRAVALAAGTTVAAGVAGWLLGRR